MFRTIGERRRMSGSPSHLALIRGLQALSRSPYEVAAGTHHSRARVTMLQIRYRALRSQHR